MFDEMFDGSCLPKVLKEAKTLSKEECAAIYEYLGRRKPKRIVEFGTQLGCSAMAFIEMSKWLGLDIQFESFDIVSRLSYGRQQLIESHVMDLTGNEGWLFDTVNPDLIFLDAHARTLTDNLIKLCLQHKVDFMAHDVSLALYERAQDQTDNFQNLIDVSPDGRTVPWEMRLLMENICPSLLAVDVYSSDDLTATFIRDLYGLCVVEMKR